MKIGNELTVEVNMTLCVWQDKASWINAVHSKYGNAFAARCEELTKDLPDLVHSWPTNKHIQIIEQVSLELKQQSPVSEKPTHHIIDETCPCPNCGCKMVHIGAFRKCMNCGESAGGG
jgi:hypothetical protein